MPVNVNDIFLVTVTGTVFGQRTMLTHTYRLKAVTGSINEDVAADGLLGALNVGGANDLVTPLSDCLATEWVSGQVWAQKIWPARFRRQVAETGGEAGEAGTSEVSNLAAVITMYTAKAGRDQQANKHIGPISPANTLVSNGQLLQGYKDLLVPLGDTLLADFATNGANLEWQPVIFHRAFPVPVYDDIIGYAIQDTVRVMRRRTVGLGI